MKTVEATTLELGEESNLEAVHRALRDAILRGDLAPGQVMSQVQLAQQMGVSRTPLREALRMLQHEGLIESEPNRRVRVAGYSVHDMEELYCTRIALESVAIRLTVPRLDSTDIAELEGGLSQMAHFAETHEYEPWEARHQQFHAVLTCKAGDRIQALLRQLSDHALRYRHLHVTRAPKAWPVGQDEHRWIVDACKARDSNLAAVRLSEHFFHTAIGVIELIEPEYRAVRLEEVLEIARTPVAATQ